ncbi:Cyclin [Thalictrum thalictroides]|uniref:Cyclin n=1 Tax=Thalictrum thalictroides TaxID=46969 RepID=A0A7J6W0M1_THATH|nr:Cyclin [Thalictrum thalictroides]
MSYNREEDSRRLINPNETEPTPPTPRVLSLLSFVLERLVARNDDLIGSPRQQQVRSLKVFDGVRAPNISIRKYLERIYKYTNCSPSCFVVGYVYIDRLVHKYPNSLVVSLNVHRLLVTSVMVAAKVLDDEHYNNAFYARVGGVSNKELNRLELELLFLLDFSVVVSSRVFESYCLHLEKELILWGNVGEKIDRLVPSGSLDDETEISVEYTQPSSSPPSQTID